MIQPKQCVRILINFYQLVCHLLSAMSNVDLVRVAVIGAGAAGIIAARHLAQAPSSFTFQVFEQTGRVGGTWVYTEEVGKDEFGLPIHSSMYKSLRTNLPKEVMGYLDCPFPEGEPSFIGHDEVLQYLENYTDKFNLRKYIQFYTKVKSVQPQQSPSKGWNLSTIQVKSQEKAEHFFDAILVCNGHYFEPFSPEIQFLSQFKGRIMHSHDYREPGAFQGKRVICFGAGPSGIDIACEVALIAQKVYLCHHGKELKLQEHPNNLQVASALASATETGFILKDGSNIDADALIFCTGYKFDFPFLQAECNIEVKDNLVTGLYKHIINISFPSMAFIGLPFRVCPFPLFDSQVQYFLATLNGKMKLPSKEKMKQDSEKELCLAKEKGVLNRHFHILEQCQWAYLQELADNGQFKTYNPVIEKLFQHVREQRRRYNLNYRNQNYILVDNNEFITTNHF